MIYAVCEEEDTGSICFPLQYEMKQRAILEKLRY